MRPPSNVNFVIYYRCCLLVLLRLVIIYFSFTGIIKAKSFNDSVRRSALSVGGGLYSKAFRARDVNVPCPILFIPGGSKAFRARDVEKSMPSPLPSLVAVKL